MTDAMKEAAATAGQNVRTFITWADVYHRVGKSLYDSTWQDYQVIEFRDGAPLKFDLSAFLRTERNLTQDAELRHIREEELPAIPIQTPTTEDIDHYHRIMSLMFKDICNIKHHVKTLKGGEMICPDPKLWSDGEYSISLILSRLTHETGDAAWQILFSPADVQQMLKFYNRIKGANKNPRGGRKETIPWEIVDQWLIEMFQNNTPPRSYNKAQEIIAKRIRHKPRPFEDQGLTDEELTPSESAVKKAVVRLRDEGRINPIGQ